MIYLDSAATTLQKPPAVARATAGAINRLASPGRGGHRPAMEAADIAFACREEAAARQAKALSAAAIAGLWPPRPGLARWLTAQALAVATAAGFCRVVAALSR